MGIYKHLKTPRIPSEDGKEEITFIDIKNQTFEVKDTKTGKKKFKTGLKIGFDIKNNSVIRN